MTKHTPQRKQTTPWVANPNQNFSSEYDGIVVLNTVWYRNVWDGHLRAFVADEPWGWHLSISHQRRYPNWDEIMHARLNLLPDDVGFAMMLPIEEEYVNFSQNVFHLHQHPPRE